MVTVSVVYVVGGIGILFMLPESIPVNVKTPVPAFVSSIIGPETLPANKLLTVPIKILS